MAREVTREQAERKRTQAAAFMERIGQSDRAQEFDDMSTDEYAEHRGLRLTNPERKRRNMATTRTTGPTKADLQEQIDSAIETLAEAYLPESTREDLAAAVGDALTTLRGEDEDDDTDDDDDDTDDDTGDDDEDDDDDDSDDEEDDDSD